MPPLILVVDDDAAVCWALEQTLSAAGYRVATAAEGRAARRSISRAMPDLVLTDVRMPGESGLDLLGFLTQAHPGLPVVVSTAHGTLETAMEAVRRGAFDYLPKPLDRAQVLAVVARAVGEAPLAAAARSSQAETVTLIGRSPVMQEVFRRLAAAAPVEATVLLTGPSGVGKSLAARLLHAHGPRASLPLVQVTASSLGDDPGPVLAAAQGGTLVLDEVTDLAPGAQARLLALLDRPLGLRLVALASHGRDHLLAHGPLRPDLVHRLALVTIPLPPLAQRMDDLPDLVRHALADIARRQGRALSLTEAALDACRGHGWPGNVRELFHRLEEAAVLATGGIIDRDHLGLGELQERHDAFAQALEREARRLMKAEPGHVHARILDQVEQELVRQALATTGGNQLKAAELLGINRITLKKRMDQAGLGQI